MRNVARTTVALLAAAASLTGCGGSDDESRSTVSDTAGSAPPPLAHVDGTIEVEGDTLTVTPTGDSERRSFSLGPAVEKAEVLAVSASGAPARVTYREGDDVATAVTPAPVAGGGVESVEGLVVSISADTLVIDADGDERSFDISGADAAAFDKEHLEDHKAAAEPIRVYFKADAPELGVAYEDA